MRRIFLTLALAFCIPMASWAQIPSKADQKTVTDTLSARLFRRDSVKSNFSLRKVIQRGDRLDLYFTASLGDHPWTLQDQKWFLGELEKEWKEIDDEDEEIIEEVTIEAEEITEEEIIAEEPKKKQPQQKAPKEYKGPYSEGDDF